MKLLFVNTKGCFWGGVERYMYVSVVVHDHDYYCPRHHKYFPVKRINCHQHFSLAYCGFCSGFMERNKAGKLRPDPKAIFHYASMLKQIKASNSFVVISEFMRTNLLMNGFEPEKIHKIHPVKTPAESMPAQKNETPVILYVGQIIRGKGVDLLIDAVSRFKCEFELRIVGKGNDEEYIKGLIKQYGIEKNVKLCGWSSDIGEYYRNCDVVAVPSRWQEPFGLVGIEAFSYGKPVVAFDVGGISEWLFDGENGFLVSEGNTEAFAQKLYRLLHEPKVREEFSRNGVERLNSDYSETAFIDSFAVVIGGMHV